VGVGTGFGSGVGEGAGSGAGSGAGIGAVVSVSEAEGLVRTSVSTNLECNPSYVTGSGRIARPSSGLSSGTYLVR